MNTDQQINEIMVHLEDLSGEKLDWAIESKWKNHAIIPVESLERIALQLEKLQSDRKQVAKPE